MEIKKGISQMEEYPNVEINYVVPKDGNMYYVLKDGQLQNGAIIATLDPKYAIDENNETDSVGVFSESGDVLIDFDKEKIEKVNDELLLVVNSHPVTEEVNSAILRKETEDDSVQANNKNVEQKLLEEMGPTGKIIFSNPYKEANVYAIDSYNNKLGLDCSVIGKNDTGLYFHTNDITTETKVIKLANPSENIAEEEIKLEDGFKISDEELNNISFEDVDKMINENNDNKLEESSTNDEEVVEDSILESKSSEEALSSTEDKVLDNAIELINKYMEEINKLNQRIKELEDIQTKQEQLIKEQEEKMRENEERLSKEENKKDELNNLLSKANEVLENIK